MRFRPRAMRLGSRRDHDMPVCTVAEYLRHMQPLEYAMLCAIAGMHDNAATESYSQWQLGVNEPLAVLERIMRQAPGSAKAGGRSDA